MTEHEETSTHVTHGEKLQKVLARLGMASRRDVEKWISEGRVKVNGAVASLGQRVDSHDAIAVDGRLLKREEVSEVVRRVLIYNKPDGEICTRNDPEGRPTVFDRLPRPKEEVDQYRSPRHQHHRPAAVHHRRRAGQPPHASIL